MPSLTRVAAKQKMLLTVLLLAGSTAALVGCSSTLDETKLESTLKDGITSQAGLAIKAVSCPKDVKLEANNTFQCQATPEKDDPFMVDVKQKDDQGNVDWNVKGIISLTKVEQEIQQGVKKQLDREVTADCGGKAKVVHAGETFECQVTDGEGKTRAAKVTATNDDGNVEWKL